MLSSWKEKDNSIQRKQRYMNYIKFGSRLQCLSALLLSFYYLLFFQLKQQNLKNKNISLRFFFLEGRTKSLSGREASLHSNRALVSKWRNPRKICYLDWICLPWDRPHGRLGCMIWKFTYPHFSGWTLTSLQGEGTIGMPVGCVRNVMRLRKGKIRRVKAQ